MREHSRLKNPRVCNAQNPPGHRSRIKRNAAACSCGNTLSPFLIRWLEVAMHIQSRSSTFALIAAYALLLYSARAQTSNLFWQQQSIYQIINCNAPPR
jgi:hypothetical protein